MQGPQRVCQAPAIWPSIAFPATLGGEMQLYLDKETTLQCQDRLVDAAAYPVFDTTSSTHGYSSWGPRAISGLLKLKLCNGFLECTYPDPCKAFPGEKKLPIAVEAIPVGRQVEGALL